MTVISEMIAALQAGWNSVVITEPTIRERPMGGARPTTGYIELSYGGNVVNHVSTNDLLINTITNVTYEFDVTSISNGDLYISEIERISVAKTFTGGNGSWKVTNIAKPVKLEKIYRYTIIVTEDYIGVGIRK
jgi:hypothetical protein